MDLLQYSVNIVIKTAYGNCLEENIWLGFAIFQYTYELNAADNQNRKN